MVQKILVTLEIDDTALDVAQIKANQLVATLCEAEERMARIIAMSANARDDMTERLATVKALAEDFSSVDDQINRVAQGMFKPPD